MAPPYRSQLLRDLATAIRARHFSPRTERAYVQWVRRYVLHHGRRHPSELGADDVNAFLSALAVESKVAASTQSQARAALLFLYREVLRIPLEVGGDTGVAIIRARQPRRLPTVLTRDEVRTVLNHMVPPARTVALLLYGGGLRLNEALHLRVRDLDEARGQLIVRSGKGDRDRVALYPKAAQGAVGEQLLRAKRIHARDLARGAGHAVLPSALPLCSGPSKTPSVPRACPTTPLATPPATPLPLTSWKMDTTSGSSRSSWATGASGPP